MVATGHRIDEDHAKTDWEIPDPGAGQRIRTKKSGTICMNIQADGEIRTLDPPEYAGQEIAFTLRDLNGAIEGFVDVPNVFYKLTTNNYNRLRFDNLYETYTLVARRNGPTDLHWVRRYDGGATAQVV